MKLTVENLHAFYGSSHVLHGVSLEVNDGESVALIGRNGAGKSTTMHAIMGVLRRITGSIRVDGVEIRGRPPHEIANKGLGLVPETRRIFGDLTVAENLQVGVKQSAGPQRWSVEAVYELFPLLAPLRYKKGKSLSGGEQQLLSIARTLVGNPAILLLDEPTQGLAPRIVESLEEQLHRLQKAGVSLLLSEQHLPFAVSLTTRAYVIEKGLIRYEGSSADVARKKEVQDEYLAV